MTSPAALSPTPFGRVVTAMVTPFDASGAVDLPLAGRLARHLVDQGSDGLVVSGTTGESPTLSWQEQLQLLQAVREAVGADAQVLAGTGSNCTAEAVEATREAAAAGADGALVVVPYYNKPPQDGLAAHFRAIAEAAPELPLMLYNIPGRTGCSMAPETVAQLMDCPNIVSFKAASGTTEEVTALRMACGSKLAIYSGDDGLTLPMMSVGAVGVVSVASHVVGLQIRAMIDAYLQGDAAVALALHEQMQPLFKALFATTNPIPVKAALQLNGWPVGAPRLPLTPLSDEMTSTLAQTMAALRQT
ncbi:4-hydroxy-tetrahydrodipicolinate synthase [Synechococcus sp. A15-28]|uniref:4-hydroxy-tetrahydrodipicolinate synthase n=1 Tax=Synechococcus sp. A15-28 TaxID=1050638 RepID=UPI001647F840|nr:4-hydroxy-tetrahydrodipicolinate synthase [Synechococcus sp. A15-28]QNI41121.1 dihydrodipicolinate synthase [Synechococcus sp. A15-28]